MELRHIRYFVAAAEELHFGRASEVLSVTRPAVSQTVADLELELGVKLFRRKAQKVALTVAGETFLKHAQVILQDLSTAIQTTKRIGEGKLGVLRIGYGSLSLHHPLFRQAIKKMGTLYPDTEIFLQELRSSTQIEEVRSDRLDAGFVFVAQDSPNTSMPLPDTESIGDLESFLIEQGGIAIAMPKDHPLAGSKSLELRELNQESFIVVRGSLVNPYFPFQPKTVQRVSNIATQINLISVGIGVGLVVLSPGVRYPKDISVVPLRNIDYTSQFKLIWKGTDQEPILQNFIGIIEDLSGKACSVQFPTY